ncbi:hypothetical protein PM082_009607 [Marasmius tenuissimus]|nr:hypothetical protein PM082_009607 [Marasmius tenuissimus]
MILLILYWWSILQSSLHPAISAQAFHLEPPTLPSTITAGVPLTVSCVLDEPGNLVDVSLLYGIVDDGKFVFSQEASMVSSGKRGQVVFTIGDTGAFQLQAIGKIRDATTTSLHTFTAQPPTIFAAAGTTALRPTSGGSTPTPPPQPFTSGTSSPPPFEPTFGVSRIEYQSPKSRAIQGTLTGVGLAVGIGLVISGICVYLRRRRQSSRVMPESS